jgi:hypothetical protein
VPYTIVAPVFFMENLLQPWMLSSLRQGKLSMALPGSRSLQQITVADARFADRFPRNREQP